MVCKSSIWKQMAEIRRGLENKVDVSVYANHEFDPWQMFQIREGLKKGLNVESYLNPGIDYKEMRKIRLELESNNE